MIPDEVDLSPTATAMYYALAHCGPASPSELSTATNTPIQSVKRALGQLREADLVNRRFDPTDARCSVYHIARK